MNNALESAGCPIDPPDDAARDRRIYLDELTRQQHTIVALRAEAFRVMAANAVLDALLATRVAAPNADETDAEKIVRLERQLAETAGLLKDHTARGPAQLAWLSVKDAAYRASYTGSRMLQLVHAGDVVSRRNGSGPISVLRASVDERLFLLGRTPRD
jgi:hypothetical protein